MNPYLTVQELLFDWQQRMHAHVTQFQQCASALADRDRHIEQAVQRLQRAAETLREAELAQRHIDTAIVRVEQDKRNIEQVLGHIERELNLFAELTEERMTQDQKSRRKLYDDAIHVDARLAQFEKQTAEVGRRINEINLQHLQAVPQDLSAVFESISEQDKALQMLSDLISENKKNVALVEDMMSR
jgi:chromosome segregation ATPase